VTFAYDLFDRQTEVHTPTQIVQYAYNASGLRIEKRIGTNATRFLLDGANVAAEVNGSSAVTYLRGLNLLKREAGSTASYYLFNAHGDVVNLTDANGTSTKSYAYDAFGVEKNAASYDANPFRYCGEYYDAETETYYLRARYYSPAGGRFQQEDAHWSPANMIYGDTPKKINERQDKLGLSYYAFMPQLSAIRQAGNLYVYCSGNPVFYSDPNGSIAITTLILLGSLAVGLIGVIEVRKYDHTLFQGVRRTA
jgi:RHS repeat-associated protein